MNIFLQHISFCHNVDFQITDTFLPWNVDLHLCVEVVERVCWWQGSSPRASADCMNYAAPQRQTIERYEDAWHLHQGARFMFTNSWNLCKCGAPTSQVGDVGAPTAHHTACPLHVGVPPAHHTACSLHVGTPHSLPITCWRSNGTPHSLPITCWRSNGTTHSLPITCWRSNSTPHSLPISC